jgi:hypothetical protein
MSAGSLVALFGDELAEVGTARLGSITMPGRDVKVSSKDLATAALALTVWDLAEQRALSVRIEAKKRFLGNSTKLLVQAAATGDGFAGLLLNACREETDVRALAERMLGGEAIDPSGRLLAIAHAELAGAGVLTPTVDGKAKTVLKAMTGKSLFESVPGADDWLRADWQELRGRWAAWAANDPDGHKRLLDAARKSIERATKSMD